MNRATSTETTKKIQSQSGAIVSIDTLPRGERGGRRAERSCGEWNPCGPG
jgi:hypothetical protein